MNDIFIQNGQYDSVSYTLLLFMKVSKIPDIVLSSKKVKDPKILKKNCRKDLKKNNCPSYFWFLEFLDAAPRNACLK